MTSTDRRMTPAASRTQAAARARRSRWRHRNGLVACSLDVNEHAVAEALIVAGRLTETEAAQPEKVRRELCVLIDDFVARWRHT